MILEIRQFIRFLHSADLSSIFRSMFSYNSENSGHFEIFFLTLLILHAKSNHIIIIIKFTTSFPNILYIHELNLHKLIKREFLQTQFFRSLCHIGRTTTILFATLLNDYYLLRTIYVNPEIRIFYRRLLRLLRIKQNGIKSLKNYHLILLTRLSIMQVFEIEIKIFLFSKR